MDPTANLKEQLKLVQCLIGDEGGGYGQMVEDGQRLAALVQALHEWLAKGNFLPAQWERK